MAEPRPGDERFPKQARLRHRTDFRRVQSGGTRVHTAHFILVLDKRRGSDPPSGALARARLGITVTRRIGTAPRRNRVRRLVREAFRRGRAAFPEGCDVVVIAKPGAADLDFDTVAAELSNAGPALTKAAARLGREERR